MLSIDLVKEIENAIKELSTSEYIHLSALLALANNESKNILHSDKNYDWLHAGAPDDVANFSRVHVSLREIPIRGLFADLENFRRNLNYPFSPVVYDKTFVSIHRIIESLTKSLEFYFARSNDNFLLFIILNNAYQLNQLLLFTSTQLKVISGFVMPNMQPVVQEGPEMKRLSLVLDSTVTYTRFILKLDAVNSIYEELARLINISTFEYPITIVKVESGSTWQEILGYPKIIQLIVKMIEDTTDYLYRNFTNEGKISALPRSVEAIESVLNLRRELKAVGVETDEIDESIRKSSVLIAQKLNNLLIGESKVTINNRVHSINEEYREKYLAASNTLLLEMGDEKKAESD